MSEYTLTFHLILTGHFKDEFFQLWYWQNKPTAPKINTKPRKLNAIKPGLVALVAYYDNQPGNKKHSSHWKMIDLRVQVDRDWNMQAANADTENKTIRLTLTENMLTTANKPFLPVHTVPIQWCSELLVTFYNNRWSANYSMDKWMHKSQCTHKILSSGNHHGIFRMHFHSWLMLNVSPNTL